MDAVSTVGLIPDLFPCGSPDISINSLYRQLPLERETPPISLGFMIIKMAINLIWCLCIPGLSSQLLSEVETSFIPVPQTRKMERDSLPKVQILMEKARLAPRPQRLHPLDSHIPLLHTGVRKFW